MPFTLCVNRTVNGKERTFRLPDQADTERQNLQEVIEAFRAGRWPMEGHLTLWGGEGGPEDPDWTKSWRWADVKDLWIEEAL
jgi:hypothetical protein